MTSTDDGMGTIVNDSRTPGTPGIDPLAPVIATTLMRGADDDANTGMTAYDAGIIIASMRGDPVPRGVLDDVILRAGSDRNVRIAIIDSVIGRSGPEVMLGVASGEDTQAAVRRIGIALADPAWRPDALASLIILDACHRTLIVDDEDTSMAERDGVRGLAIVIAWSIGLGEAEASYRRQVENGDDLADAIAPRTDECTMMTMNESPRPAWIAERGGGIAITS